MILRCGLELFRFLDHTDDAVVAAAAGSLFHTNGAVALFDDGAGIDITAFRSADGQRLTRDGRLIDHRLTGNDFAVKRDHTAGTNDNAVADLNVCHRNEYRTGVRLFPDFVHIQGHRLREVGNGLLVRPFIENIANTQQEHDRARRLEVLTQHRDRDRRRIQYRHLNLLVQQAVKPGLDIRHGAHDRDQRAHSARDEQLLHTAPAQRCNQPVLKFAAHGAAAMLRSERLFVGIGKRCKCLNDGCARRVIADHSVTCAVINRCFGYTLDFP